MRRVLVSGVAVAALLGSTLGPAQSASALTFIDKTTFTFLTAKQAPKDATYPKWTQTKTVRGLKSSEHPCYVEKMVNSKTEHRAFYGSYKVEGQDYDSEYSITQYGLRTSSETAAKALIKRIAACVPAKDTNTQDAVPHYGTYKVKSGLTVGVSPNCGAAKKDRDATQWAYGRDKRDVMVMHFYTKRGTCNPSKDRWVTLAKKALQQF